MNELIEKIENLKENLDTNSDIRRIRELNKKIRDDQQLVNLIEEYRRTNNIALKQEILENKLFKEYKQAETEINILILAINSKLRKIINKGSCHRENN